MWWINAAMVLLSVGVISSDITEPNVCRNAVDYLLKSENCWYDPDVDASLAGIIQNHGLSVKNYTVTTDDGYTLTIFRITGTLNNPMSLAHAQPLLFQHGVLRDGRCWLLRGDLSPAIYYAKKGYQVWLGNARGTAFSSHLRYSQNDKEYWDFSFHEIGTKDVPAMLQKIAEETGQAGNIIYIGHSMGTTASYVYASVYPTQAKRYLKAIISLAPIAFMDKVSSVIKLSETIGPLKNTLSLTHTYNFNITFLEKSCLLNINVCKLGIQQILGISEPNMYDQIFPIIVTHGSTPFGVKMALHFAQIIRSHGNFRQYNYLWKNTDVYASSEPPPYDVSKIIVDVHLIYANNDQLSTGPDVEVLKSKLVGINTSITQVPTEGKLSHMDFLIGVEMEKEIFTPITKILEQYK